MLNKKLTFLMVPDSDGEFRQLDLKVWMLWSLLGLIILIVGASLYLASVYLGDQVNRSELEQLRAENEQLAEKFEQLRWNLSETESRYSDLVQKEVYLRSIFGLPEINPDERQLGIGGPVMVDPASLSPTNQLAYSSEAEVDRLLRLSRFELEKFDEAENALMNLEDRLDHTPSIWPTKGWNSRGYGMKYDPFTGYEQFHRGIDIANHTGTAIIAPADGKIKEVGTYGGMGKMIVVDHGYGFMTRYGHLSSIDVKRGQKIARGDVIGKMGSTGYSTGPHLHYEVWRNGKVMDPRKFILNTK